MYKPDNSLLEVKDKIKAIYMSSPETSLQAICKQYKAKYSSIVYYFRKEKWQEKRSMLFNKVEQKIFEALTEQKVIETVKAVKSAIYRLLPKAILVYDKILSGTAGKVAYGQVDIAKDVLDRVGIKAPERIEIGINKFNQDIEAFNRTLLVKGFKPLDTLKPKDSGPVDIKEEAAGQAEGGYRGPLSSNIQISNPVTDTVTESVVKSEDPIITPEELKVIDNITKQQLKIDEVKHVPEGSGSLVEVLL